MLRMVRSLGQSKKKRMSSMRGMRKISHGIAATTDAVRGTACRTPISPKSCPLASVPICSVRGLLGRACHA